jgi:Trk K+ transport system NAD-binding subunit
MILPMPALPPSGGHFIVCGDGPLAFRVAEELTSRYRERVTVLLPSARRNSGPMISGLRDVHVIERSALTTEAFTDADVASARAVALLWQDDIVNFHAALRAQELHPRIRLVLSVFNTRLGAHFHPFFDDCTVLSGTAMAAPSFVAAALGETAPSHVEVFGRTLYVARRDAVQASQVVCGLATVPGDPAGTTRLLAPGTPYAEPEADLDITRPGSSPAPGDERLVLAVANGNGGAGRRNPLRPRRRLVHIAMGVARKLTWNRFGAVLVVLLAALVAGFALVLSAVYPVTGATYSVSDAIYLTLMDLTGSALTNVTLSGPEKLSQVVLTVDGMAFIPLVTAVIVSARLTGSLRREPVPRGGHVIVAGQGNIGAQVVRELHDLGFGVACVDPDAKAQGMVLARRLGLPTVVGDAFNEETLRAAGIDSCIALVSVTSNDNVNLETALQANALRGGLRIAARVFDDDLAQRVQRTVGNIVSRSISYMAAPAFAAAMLEHSVLRVIAVGRHVLLISDVRVADGGGLAGQRLVDLESDGLARVLALQARGELRPDWSPRRDYQLAADDRVIVVATRAGLGRFLAGNKTSLSSRVPVTSSSSGLAHPAIRSYAESVSARTMASSFLPGGPTRTSEEGPPRPGWQSSEAS